MSNPPKLSELSQLAKDRLGRDYFAVREELHMLGEELAEMRVRLGTLSECRDEDALALQVCACVCLCLYSRERYV